MDLIAVLDPDDPSIDWDVVQPSAPRVPKKAVRRASRRRWPWVVAAAVAVGAVVVAAVVVGRSPTEERPAEGRFLLVDPRLRAYSTDIVTPFDDSGLFRVWAAGGPQEPHLDIQVDAQATEPFVEVGGSIRSVQGLDVIDTLGEPGRVTVVRDLEGGARLVVRATEVSDADVVAVVNGSTVDISGGRVVDVLIPADVQARLGLEEVASARWEAEALYGNVETAMRYLDDQANVVTLREAKGSLADQVAALGYLSSGTPQARGDRVIGRLAGSGDIVTLWQQGGYVLSLTGPGDPARYDAWSWAVRAATATEWTRQLMFLRPDYRIGEFEVLGRGSNWTAGVQRAERGGATKLLWWFTVPSEGGASTSVPVRFDPTVEPFADRVVIDGVTYVFVSTPATSGVSDATVFFGDTGVAQLTLTQPFADIPVLVAATRVDGPGEVRVMAPAVVDA